MRKVLGPAVVTLIFRSLAWLPLSLLQALGACVGWLTWQFPGTYKRRAEENFSRAFPSSNASMHRAAMLSVGKMMLEMPYWWVRRNEAQLNRQVECKEWQLFDAALQSGKGVILLSPHVGCFELLGPIYSSRHKSTVLFRPPRQIWLQAWIVKMRSRPQLTMAPANLSGVRTLVKTLLRGQTIGILPDQVPTLGEGVWAPFFGRPAYTMTLVQRLQSLSGATIFIIGAERKGIGRGYRLHIHPMPQPLSADPVSAATEINHQMEEMIRRMPTQYLWGYNRYKTPAS
ncbi:lysophospholipid acyltransferase family protein [Herbaspirillum sp. RTI4]|uniref:lysophospholipid acyltransferase family protein n=1 Tax=Herbaspirillum sp. RTI4 TaxID=3048640 RepID=UPI002AB32975|nr:lysophospholipid acyltransferase family protein [Herbaspirillum sp. RTI4]MDY7578047.1 lysophospholipid acyltransferase family protein [Herbaspirillum sp. RTI4]MEA9983177.1 lysophospholipid acyltransferase family protein [Herbaspirillum sp. RTI4]